MMTATDENDIKPATKSSMKSTPPLREVRIEEDVIDKASTSTTRHAHDLAEKRRQFMSQPSTLATRRQQAVCVRRAHKSYGPKANKNVVLDGLNMTVPKGSM